MSRMFDMNLNKLYSEDLLHDIKGPSDILVLWSLGCFYILVSWGL